jgi:hypothetical protein
VTLHIDFAAFDVQPMLAKEALDWLLAASVETNLVAVPRNAVQQHVENSHCSVPSGRIIGIHAFFPTRQPKPNAARIVAIHNTITPKLIAISVSSKSYGRAAVAR